MPDRDTFAYQVDLWTSVCPKGSAASNEWSLLLSDEEIARALRFLFQKDRIRFIYSHAVLRRVLASYMGEPPQQLQFTVGDAGKPALRPTGTIFFNLSHSQDDFAIAVAQGRPVGVDVEQLQWIADLEQMAERIMNEREHSIFRHCSQKRQLAWFYRCWVRKEAIVKARGSGTSDEFKDIFVSECRFGWTAANVHEGHQLWSGVDFWTGNSLVGAVCAAGAPTTIRVRSLNI